MNFCKNQLRMIVAQVRGRSAWNVHVHQPAPLCAQQRGGGTPRIGEHRTFPTHEANTFDCRTNVYFVELFGLGQKRQREAVVLGFQSTTVVDFPILACLHRVVRCFTTPSQSTAVVGFPYVLACTGW